MRAIPTGTAIVFYDGVCGLCDRTVQLALRHDRGHRLRFASLQSDLARETLARYGKNPTDLDTVCVLANYGDRAEQLLVRADAVLYVLSAFGGIWRLSAVGHLLPRALRSGIYNFIARRRYRWFGRYDTCRLPAPGQREWFVDSV